MKTTICALLFCSGLLTGCGTPKSGSHNDVESAARREQFVSYWSHTLEQTTNYDSFPKISGVGHTVYLAQTQLREGGWLVLVGATPHERGFDGIRTRRFTFNALVLRDSDGHIYTSDYPFVSWKDLVEKKSDIPAKFPAEFYTNASKYRIQQIK